MLNGLCNGLRIQAQLSEFPHEYADEQHMLIVLDQLLRDSGIMKLARCGRQNSFFNHAKSEEAIDDMSSGEEHMGNMLFTGPLMGWTALLIVVDVCVDLVVLDVWSASGPVQNSNINR